jgi:hypothetical protein
MDELGAFRIHLRHVLRKAVNNVFEHLDLPEASDVEVQSWFEMIDVDALFQGESFSLEIERETDWGVVVLKPMISFRRNEDVDHPERG